MDNSLAQLCRSLNLFAVQNKRLDLLVYFPNRRQDSVTAVAADVVVRLTSLDEVQS